MSQTSVYYQCTRHDIICWIYCITKHITYHQCKTSHSADLTEYDIKDQESGQLNIHTLPCIREYHIRSTVIYYVRQCYLSIAHGADADTHGADDDAHGDPIISIQQC